MIELPQKAARSPLCSASSGLLFPVRWGGGEAATLGTGGPSIFSSILNFTLLPRSLGTSQGKFSLSKLGHGVPSPFLRWPGWSKTESPDLPHPSLLSLWVWEQAIETKLGGGRGSGRVGRSPPKWKEEVPESGGRRVVPYCQSFKIQKVWSWGF